MHSIRHISISSAALECHAPVTILTPRDMGTGRRYPVLYLLHSLSSSPTPQICAALRSWLLDMPFIVVLPNGDRSFYINTHDGRRYEDYLVEELVPIIDEMFPTLPARSCRAIGGPSMGGYGALMLGLRHRELFGVVFSQSGAIRAPEWVTDGPHGCVFGPLNSSLRSTYDLFRLACEPGDTPALYLDCGLDDFLLAENREFRAFLQVRAICHTYREHIGEHPGSYFNESSYRALRFVRETVLLQEVTSP